ncbi:MAG: hypothetical protein M1814_006656 [Vezdaea aestivalis]|nr:MAG: hypothetical protein M1814_006656 [Vezdaea aestivalis]
MSLLTLLLLTLVTGMGLPVYRGKKTSKAEQRAMNRIFLKDRNIKCFGGPPFTVRYYGNSRYGPGDFRSADDFCKYHEGRPSLAAYCDSEESWIFGTGQIMVHKVKPDILKMTASIYDTNTKDFCEERCLCNRDWKRLVENAKTRGERGLKRLLRDFSNGIPKNPSTSTTLYDSMAPGADQAPAVQRGCWSASEAMERDGDEDGATQDSCPLECARGRCESTGADCICVAQDPIDRVFQSLACASKALLMPVSGQLGRRDEGVACACNGSYVSQDCCGVENGLVWEGGHLNLGELSQEMQKNL